MNKIRTGIVDAKGSDGILSLRSLKTFRIKDCLILSDIVKVDVRE